MEQNKPSAKWFIDTQSDWFIQNGIPEWFHGIITRKDAEDLLKDRTPGCFLIRVSESRIGYSLSYRAKDRCRHFMIDVLKDQQVSIVGDARVHRTLDDLVKFYMKSALFPYNEILTEPCGQKTHTATDYEELFEDRKILATPFQTSIQSSCGDLATGGATVHSVFPPVAPRKSQTLDASSQMMGFLCNSPSAQSGSTLYPALPTMRTTSSAISVLPNRQPTIVKAKSVDSSVLSTAHQTNCHNMYEEKQDHGPTKPMKACRNAMSRAVSLMTEGDIAQDFKKMENAMATHMKSVKDSLGRMGQPVKKNGSHTLQHNNRHTYMQEEYKKPPPFAPGFC